MATVGKVSGEIINQSMTFTPDSWDSETFDGVLDVFGKRLGSLPNIREGETASSEVARRVREVNSNDYAFGSSRGNPVITEFRNLAFVICRQTMKWTGKKFQDESKAAGGVDGHNGPIEQYMRVKLRKAGADLNKSEAVAKAIASEADRLMAKATQLVADREALASEVEIDLSDFGS